MGESKNQSIAERIAIPPSSNTPLILPKNHYSKVTILNGWDTSFGGVLTYKKAKNLRQNLKSKVEEKGVTGKEEKFLKKNTKNIIA